MSQEKVVAQMRESSAQADALRARASKLLTQAARAGAQNGMTQREIAAVIGRSQPEVSRLLRFHGDSPLGQKLARARKRVVLALAEIGGKNPRVFGSVARGDDTETSDIDILVDFVEPVSLFELARLEHELAAYFGVPVDIVPSKTLRRNLSERVLREAVPL